MARWRIWGLAVLLVACGRPSPFPDMQPGEYGRVVNVIDGDALILDTGQSVRLVSIEAPALYPRGRAPDPYAAESARMLEDLVLGRRVQLFYPAVTRDRYDRALAHVITADGAGPIVWLNAEMLRRGGAWVRLYPDTAARAAELFSIERTAQDAGRGLWSTSNYAIADAADISETTLGFRVVHARLGEALPIPEDTRYPPACIRTLQAAQLQLHIRRDARTACGLPVGTQTLIRGYVSALELDLTYPRHLEQVPDD